MKTVAAVNEFLYSRIASDRSPLTISWYRQRLSPFALACPRVPKRAAPIEAHLATLHCSPVEKLNRYNALRALYRFLRKRHKFPNPMDLIETPSSSEDGSMATLEAEELMRLLYTEAPLRDRTLLTLLEDTGIRAGEVCGLRKQDIKTETIMVRGKTGKREVPISEETRRLLAALTAQDKTGGEYVFYSSKGQPMSRNCVYRIVNRYMKKAAIQGPKLGPHRIRHAFGKNYLVEGGDVRSLQKIMGHKRITTTQKYAELSQRDIIDKHHKFTPLRAAHAAAQQGFFDTDKTRAVKEAEEILAEKEANHNNGA